MEAEEFMKVFDSCWFGSPKNEVPSTAMLMLFKINQTTQSAENIQIKPKIKNMVENEKCFSPNCSCRRKGLSRSLSALEFQEVKGFMDLGFVFDEEEDEDDKIIPGLQKWRQMVNEDKKVVFKKWKMLSTKNDMITMKDHLRFWARVVASNAK